MPARKRQAAVPVTVIGTGRVATAMGGWLAQPAVPARLRAVVGRKRGRASAAQRLIGRGAARTFDEFLAELPHLSTPALVLIAVSDDAVAELAARMATARGPWRGFTVFHTSGTLGSRALAPLAAGGASIGSIHPMMTFPAARIGSLPIASAGVVCSLEGDPGAVRQGAALVRAWGGLPLPLDPAAKRALHLAATLVGPGAVIHMAAAESLLRRAGLRGKPARIARQALVALLTATAAHLADPALTTASTYTGPIARGDASTVAAQRSGLGSPTLRRLYAALVETSLGHLPSPNQPAVRRALGTTRWGKKIS